MKRIEWITPAGLLVTLILIFTLQGEMILNHPLHIALIAVPIIVQTYFIFAISYLGARKLKIPFSEAAPSSFIAPSNFFELAVATTLILFGATSGATLATVVGVLVEVPVMLSLVKIMKKIGQNSSLRQGYENMNENNCEFNRVMEDGCCSSCIVSPDKCTDSVSKQYLLLNP